MGAALSYIGIILQIAMTGQQLVTQRQQVTPMKPTIVNVYQMPSPQATPGNVPPPVPADPPDDPN